MIIRLLAPKLQAHRVPLANVGALRTSGVDVAANYAWNFDSFGLGGNGSRLALTTLLTWVEKNTFQANPTSAIVDRVGTVGGTPRPSRNGRPTPCSTGAPEAST